MRLDFSSNGYEILDQVQVLRQKIHVSIVDQWEVLKADWSWK